MTTKHPYRILLADDHGIVRIGLRLMIGNIDNNIHIEEAFDGLSVIAKLKTGGFDLLMLDINMPDTESFSLSAWLIKEFPSMRIIIFTMCQELTFAMRFLKMGVHGYVLKRSNEEEIKSAIRSVMNGRTYISDWLAQAISEERIAPKPKTPFDALSDRELEVTLQILRGSTVSRIADTLHLNRSTIGTHKSRIMKKLGITSTIDLFKLAKANGLM
jgi:DNA-binding NarL/FixJ family response regulator